MEFKEYENAIEKYFKTLKINKSPLKCWSFYGNYFEKLKTSLSDTTLLDAIVTNNNWNTNWSFQEELNDETVIVVTDATLNIVFASKNMIKMNGYVPNEVIGNSPKMFQGDLTDDTISREISIAVKTQQSFEKTIMNYCKDGSLYKCHIKGYPIFNKKGVLTNFIAFEKIAA
ncbi:PAS domain-containing protein [Flavobacterium sp.]|uniref:PAS domain-containing protein n=1 Tax=Flavobacterium sp. TaxID=239 RepID=UPI003751FCD3